MSLATDLRNFSNLTVGLRSLLRMRVNLQDALATVRRLFDQREANFLTTVRDAIFGNPTSPYHPLLEHAGCTYSDIERMVRTQGLEPTLRSLRDAGVYFSFEEFKGRDPVIRGGREFHVLPEHFRNPLVPHHYWAQSGGSTGPSARVSANLGRAVRSANYMLIRNAAYGVTGVPRALWRGLMPSELNTLIASAIVGEVPERWFTPMLRSDLRTARRFPPVTYSILALARMYGAKLPWPEPVPLESAHLVARWAAAAIRTRGQCYIHTTVSMSLRVCVAARADGIDLTGAMFSGGGEPFTPAKAAGIAAAGATCRPGYFCAEASAVALSCANPSGDEDYHVLEDAIGLIQVARRAPGSDQIVKAFNLTTLLPTASNVLLNLELDDYGDVETRSCGCIFETLGFTRHIRKIRSFRKLTGEGVSLVGSEMTRVLEEVLPATFGGSALDYQLSEGEDAQGFTRLTVIVSPRVHLPSESAVIAAVLKALGTSDASADYARATWTKAGTFRVERAEPQWTTHGKFPVLQRLSKAAATRDRIAG